MTMMSTFMGKTHYITVYLTQDIYQRKIVFTKKVKLQTFTLCSPIELQSAATARWALCYNLVVSKISASLDARQTYGEHFLGVASYWLGASPGSTLMLACDAASNHRTEMNRSRVSVCIKFATPTERGMLFLTVPHL